MKRVFIGIRLLGLFLLVLSGVATLLFAVGMFIHWGDVSEFVNTYKTKEGRSQLVSIFFLMVMFFSYLITEYP